MANYSFLHLEWLGNGKVAKLQLAFNLLAANLSSTVSSASTVEIVDWMGEVPSGSETEIVLPVVSSNASDS